MIDEFLEPGEDQRDTMRYIPIRGRNEFLPSVASLSTTGSRPDDEQLELPLARAQQSACTDAADRIIRFPRKDQVGQPLPIKPPEQLGRRAKRPFTVGGFLMGCAMGSAAAAVLLLLVRIVIS
jgi:hypothetical protein